LKGSTVFEKTDAKNRTVILMRRYRGRRYAIAGMLFGMLLLAGCEYEKNDEGMQSQQSLNEDMQLQGDTTEYDTEAEEDAVVRTSNVILPELPDLREEFQIILSESPKEFFLDYPINDAFLLWVTANYGEKTVQRLAEHVQSGTTDASLWYDLTGSSVHVLWLEYCRSLNYSSYLLSNVTWVDCADNNEVTMDFIGDINFGEDWYTTGALDERGGELESCISPEILEELSSADITMANNEFTFSTGGTATKGKTYVFRANPARVSYYEKMGVDLVSLANNHTWDYGEEALLDTMNTLKEAGIPYVGAGRNRKEAEGIRYFVANGRKIAIVSATQIERYYRYTREATESSPGVLKTLEPELFLDVIREAKENSDYVIAYVHWGTEGRLYPDADEKELAEQFVDAGADIILGDHAHRLQGMTYTKDTPVLYSLGNFWFSTGDLYTTIVQLKINKFGELSVTFIPCEQKELTVSILKGEDEVDGFYKYIADLSSDVGIDKNGTAYNLEHTEEKVRFEYLSGMEYAAHDGGLDLEGNGIDIVGNLK
jgi:poly-gamma-glutamate synthesis protein (capsule biosynthesis protein)